VTGNGAPLVVGEVATDTIVRRPRIAFGISGVDSSRKGVLRCLPSSWNQGCSVTVAGSHPSLEWHPPHVPAAPRDCGGFSVVVNSLR